MRLTQHTDLALRVLIYLALIGNNRATIQQISDAYAISHNHLTKVAHKLAVLGYIRSMRGAGGGIELALPPQQVALGDFVSRVEPEFAPVECFRPDNRCVITPDCALPPMLAEAMAAFTRTLNRYTLADLISPRHRAGLKRTLKLR